MMGGCVGLGGQQDGVGGWRGALAAIVHAGPRWGGTEAVGWVGWAGLGQAAGGNRKIAAPVLAAPGPQRLAGSQP
jgi:hypothetical protein